ncbi:hypothetical protein [Psychrobacillus vulpis]|uniref:Uncharacterized protein n=1 Tax=Psychrobacillus vulpis TaxID=2325572 RepID=A0A544TAY7_9BACI|nr:hypothetical protein [Psychrobacillus vulpis]TQR14625.1 hypothetical protein FG384_19600 [Psychrobacillus vulpis]
MRQSSQEVLRKLNTDYIDAELKGLSYDHTTHIVRMSYYGPNESECTILFRDCFSATFNTWLEGMKGSIPQRPEELSFYFQEIEIEDVEVNGILLYKCSLVIPMMDCQITCVSIEIKN